MKLASAALAVALATSLCITTTNASMRSSSELVQGASQVWTEAVTAVQNTVESALTTPNKPDKAILLVDYHVPPSHQGEFVDIFKTLQKSIEHEKGAIVFGLSRTIDRNDVFYLYSEWDTQADYSKHFTGDAFKAFADDVAKINVLWQLHFLKKETSYTKQTNVASDKPDKAILLVNYDVPPSHQVEFVDIFETLQKAAEQTEGALVFGLSRTVDRNNIFYLYSEWDTQASSASHFTSDAFKAFAEDVAKINVEWQLHFLKQETSFIHP